MNQPQNTSDDEVLALPGFEDDDDDDDAPTTRPVARARRGSRRWLIVISIVLVLLILGGILVALRAGRGPSFSYTSQQVQTGTLALTVLATGPVQANVYNVDFSGSGKISEIDVSIGQQVKQGQTLAKLDMTSLQDALNQAQAAVYAAENSLGAAQTNLSRVEAAGSSSISVAYDQEQNALNTCDNTPNPAPKCEQLAEDQYTQAQRQAYSQDASASSQVTSANGQLQTANAQLQTAQDNLKNATLTAPHSGIVAVVNGSAGSVPGASSTSSSATTGAPGASTFIEIVDTTSLQVYANVNEANIAGVQVGQTTAFTVSAYGPRQFSGTVKAISPLGQTNANVVTYTVVVQVNMQSLNGARLLPDMTASTTITTVSRPDVVLVPVSAVNFAQSATSSGQTSVPGNAITQSQAQSAQTQARQMMQNLENSNPGIAQDSPTATYVLEYVNKQLVLKPVVLGLTDGTSYEVLAGLAPGESVVTASQQVGRGVLPRILSGGKG